MQWKRNQLTYTCSTTTGHTASTPQMVRKPVGLRVSGDIKVSRPKPMGSSKTAPSDGRSHIIAQ
ncbi:hypothetical protein B9Q03_07395 [Candidatus Marsarchaeota G2 archaeon OSP_D]|uniref:Uncharacterized protein n=3 Tax=Candidatus Marsarchaeota group 2 TaxID=2203771 RepID=A0A2R6BZU2_9ARCH|nr:MAG: hypothetical protein B9Q03_07395 [Candidatus Marsarchaeota G2 archaeon OSP_D]PSN92979.1 MAG: hypothetical protein B9Q08_00075 [Candidatus Marsarchaeota G2 archaeon ECH_B_SAG-M15]PSO04026.1 MAG: hypothetical protein B9Q04_19680 [Candidatus Marsarchaeota G2 archaeon BE_D]